METQLLPTENELAEVLQDVDRASLESWVGAAFFPGIEAGWLLRDKYEYLGDDPFRLNPQQSDPQCPVLTAGDITKQMAVPWQADFAVCSREPGKTFAYSWLGLLSDGESNKKGATVRTPGRPVTATQKATSGSSHIGSQPRRRSCVYVSRFPGTAKRFRLYSN